MFHIIIIVKLSIKNSFRNLSGVDQLYIIIRILNPQLNLLNYWIIWKAKCIFNN